MKKLTSIAVTLAAAAGLTGGLPVHHGPRPRLGRRQRRRHNPPGQGRRLDDLAGHRVYDIRFNRTITTCSWVGTVGYGSFAGATGPAMITMTGRSGTNNGLFVRTYDSTGTPAALPFSADVVCG